MKIKENFYMNFRLRDGLCGGFHSLLRQTEKDARSDVSYTALIKL